MGALKLLWNSFLEPYKDSEQTLSFDKSIIIKNSVLL